MKKINNIITGVFLISILITSCKKNEPTLEVVSPIEKAQINNDTIIVSTGMYHLSPNEREIDSLKKIMGDDNFYTVADDSNFYTSKIYSQPNTKITPVKFDKINFKNENFLFSKKTNKNNWLIIDYKVGYKPQIYSLVDFYLKLSEENSSAEANTSNLDEYLNNIDFLNFSLDINGDGKEDKIFGNKPNTGDNLIIYFYENNGYVLKLKSTNFSQDGGNQVSEIKKTSAGFVIITSFPDRGFLKCEYYIEYKENKWILSNTIYKTKSSNEENAFIYKCDVKQNLDYSNPNLKVNSMPDENDREKVCTKEFNKDENKPSLIYIIDDSSGYYNLRKGKNNNSEIIQKIKTGEVVNVLYSKGDWWLIETKEKNRGYAFKDKVVIKK